MKKTALAIALLLALSISSSKIYNFYIKTVPPYAVGECFAVSSANRNMQFTVTNNNRLKMTSRLIAKVNSIFITQEIPTEASFEELRDQTMEKLPCK